MGIIQVLLYLLVMATALPVGLLLAWLCRDELVAGRKWFKLIIYSSVIILAIILLVWGNAPMSLSIVYMILVTAVSLYKGKDRKFAI